MSPVATRSVHTRQPFPLSMPWEAVTWYFSITDTCSHLPPCLQLCHCLGTGLRGGTRGGARLSKERFGFMAHQIAPAICTTEQDAAHCGPKGTGLSSSSHLHRPLQCLADPNGLWGRLPPHSGMPAVNFPGFLCSDKHSSKKSQSYVSSAAAGVWTPGPVLNPALLHSWCTYREDKGR